MITIKNFSDVEEEKIEKLSSSLNVLSIPDFTIEVWNTARDVHSPEEIKRFHEENPAFNPDESAGEVWKRKIRLFRSAFSASPKRTVYVALHEIGHFVTGDEEKAGDEEKDEEKADKWVKKLCPSYDLDKRRR